MARPSLSYPAAKPTGFLKVNPKAWTGFSGVLNICLSSQFDGGKLPAKLIKRSVMRCASSGLSRNKRERKKLYINQKPLDGMNLECEQIPHAAYLHWCGITRAVANYLDRRDRRLT